MTAVVSAYLYYCKRKQEENEKSSPKALISASKEDVGRELCSYVVRAAKRAMEERGKFYFAVAGGSLLDLLGGLEDYKDQVDFSKFFLVCVNHKCVSPDDPKSTVAKCKAKFCDSVGIRDILMPAAKPLEGSNGEKEAEFYENALRESGVPHFNGYPQLDLILLGLGADGHVGSCHPMGPAVTERKKSVAASPKSGEPSSITLTIESMNASKQVAVIVCGGSKGKKEAVKRAFQRPMEYPRGRFPAQLLKSPIFFLDAEAAADL